MTQQVRINFLNWQPDKEPLGNEGLHVAENVLHDTEGYKEVRAVPEGDWSLDFLNYTMTAIQVRQIGSLRDSSPNSKLAATLRGGDNQRMDVADPATSSFFTFLSFSTAPATSYGLTAFQVAELNGYAVVCAQTDGLETGGTALSSNLTGYIDLS